MADETPSVSPASSPKDSTFKAVLEPKASSAQEEEMGPLTPVFLVWPRKTFAQTWVFLWIGVSFVIAGLLPWYGYGDVYLINRKQEAVSRAEYQQSLLVAEARRVPLSEMDFPSSEKPGVELGALAVLLCGIGLVINGIKNIWTRRLVFWPITLTVFVVLCALWFCRGFALDPGHASLLEVSAFQQVGDVCGVISDALKPPGTAGYHDFHAVVDRFGAGVYLTLAAWSFLIAVILGSVVAAVITSGKKKKAAAPAKGRSGRRPGARR